MDCLDGGEERRPPQKAAATKNGSSSHGRIGRCGLRRKSGGKPSHSIGYWARKAASRETDSPPGLVRTSCCEPAAMVGVVNESVFISLNVTVADVPPKVAVVAD